MKAINFVLKNYAVASILSPVFHFALFGLRRRTARFENGLFITSIDVDVGNEKVGVINQGRFDRDIISYVSERFVGEVEQRNLPILFNLFEEFEIPVTFAFRGQLFDVDLSLPRLVMGSSIGHEIASHGYYHRAFTSLSHDEANEEFQMMSKSIKKLSVVPKSFVFPRNKIAHLDLLKKYGYVCYRGSGGFIRDGMSIRKDCDELYDVHPSLWLGWIDDPFFVKRIVDICVRRKLPFHVWFHPRDIGAREKRAKKLIKKMLSPLLRYAKEKERAGTLTFETMFSATKKACAHVSSLTSD